VSSSCRSYRSPSQPSITTQPAQRCGSSARVTRPPMMPPPRPRPWTASRRVARTTARTVLAGQVGPRCGRTRRPARVRAIHQPPIVNHRQLRYTLPMFVRKGRHAVPEGSNTRVLADHPLAHGVFDQGDQGSAWWTAVACVTGDHRHRTPRSSAPPDSSIRWCQHAVEAVHRTT